MVNSLSGNGHSLKGSGMGCCLRILKVGKCLSQRGEHLQFFQESVLAQRMSPKKCL